MVELQQLERELITLLVCPECGSDLVVENGVSAARCRGCGKLNIQVEGIWRLLTPAQQRRYQPFTANYRSLRQKEGWERTSEEYYLKLPNIKSNDPQATIWRIRKCSLQILQKQTAPGQEKWALDLGAGNGWLSRRLVHLGFRVVAVDLNVEGPDSLEGAALYQHHDNIWFGRVQASMEYLPFGVQKFALIVASGSLHYAALELTLPAIWRSLQSGGRFIITDSPIYNQLQAGSMMVTEYRQRAASDFGQEPQWVGGKGFFGAQELLQQLQQQGFEVSQFSVERRLGKLKRNLLRSFKQRHKKREEASFPVIIATKPR